MSKEMVISANRHETSVALLEDDQLVEVHFQRAHEYSLAGSIHKGRVTRVLPGMQSAFVDLGLERDTFLYVSDFLEETRGHRSGDRRRASGRDGIVAAGPGAPSSPASSAKPRIQRCSLQHCRSRAAARRRRRARDPRFRGVRRLLGRCRTAPPLVRSDGRTDPNRGERRPPRPPFPPPPAIAAVASRTRNTPMPEASSAPVL